MKKLILFSEYSLFINYINKHYKTMIYYYTQLIIYDKFEDKL